MGAVGKRCFHGIWGIVTMKLSTVNAILLYALSDMGSLANFNECFSTGVCARGESLGLYWKEIVVKMFSIIGCINGKRDASLV